MASGRQRRAHHKANTTQRGYGHNHQQRRKALLPAALGTRCPAHATPRCTTWMTDPRLMHLDHTTPLALGGTHGDRIICKPCNLSLGATLGNRMRQGVVAVRRAQTRAW
jgi:hypothetical protein